MHNQALFFSAIFKTSQKNVLIVNPAQRINPIDNTETYKMCNDIFSEVIFLRHFKQSTENAIEVLFPFSVIFILQAQVARRGQHFICVH